MAASLGLGLELNPQPSGEGRPRAWSRSVLSVFYLGLTI